MPLSIAPNCIYAIKDARDKEYGKFQMAEKEKRSDALLRLFLQFEACRNHKIPQGLFILEIDPENRIRRILFDKNEEKSLAAFLGKKYPDIQLVAVNLKHVLSKSNHTYHEFKIPQENQKQLKEYKPTFGKKAALDPKALQQINKLNEKLKSMMASQVKTRSLIIHEKYDDEFSELLPSQFATKEATAQDVFNQILDMNNSALNNYDNSEAFSSIREELSEFHQQYLVALDELHDIRPAPIDSNLFKEITEMKNTIDAHLVTLRVDEIKLSNKEADAINLFYNLARDVMRHYPNPSGALEVDSIPVTSTPSPLPSPTVLSIPSPLPSPTTSISSAPTSSLFTSFLSSVFPLPSRSKPLRIAPKKEKGNKELDKIREEEHPPKKFKPTRK